MSQIQAVLHHYTDLNSTQIIRNTGCEHLFLRHLQSVHQEDTLVSSYTTQLCLSLFAGGEKFSKVGSTSVLCFTLGAPITDCKHVGAQHTCRWRGADLAGLASPVSTPQHGSWLQPSIAGTIPTNAHHLHCRLSCVFATTLHEQQKHYLTTWRAWTWRLIWTVVYMHTLGLRIKLVEEITSVKQ